MRINKFLLILIIVGFLVYFNSLFNGFVWDDEEQVLNNTLVHSFSNLPAFFSSSTFNSGGAGSMGGLYYKPLMTTSFSMLYTLFGPNPFFFHLFQLIFHLGNGILVFLIFHYLLKKEFLAFFLALIFLIHPINTEAVVYISDLQDILFFFFGTLALLWVIKNKLKTFNEIFLVSLFLLLSFLSKETGFLFILIIFSFIILFKRHQQLKSFLISLVITVGSYSFLRFVVAGIFFNKHGLSPITKMPLEERILSIPKIIYTYLKNFVFPKDLAINQHWAVTEINRGDFYQPLIIVFIFFIILLSIALFIWKFKKSLLQVYSFFFLWFIFALGLHLQIFPLDLTISDRWFYLPIVGLLGIIGVIVKEFNIQRISKFTLMLIVILIIFSLSVRTIIRNTNWKNGLTLYSHDVLVSRDSFDLENNLGVELFRVGRIDEAKIHFEKSTRLAPEWWTNWNNLGVIAEKDGDYQKAKEYYEKAISHGEYYLAYENLANLLLFYEKNPKDAKKFIEESLKKLPENAKLWFILALSEYKLGNQEKALQASTNAYFLSPSQQNYYLYSRLSQKLPIEF